MKRLVCAAALLLAAPASAFAAGGPVAPMQGGSGVALPGGPDRFVAVHVRGGTLVERIATRDGTLLVSRLIRRDLGVAGAAYDGSGTGLSADGDTLVLTNMIRSYPPRRTTLVGLDGRRLRELWARTLRGYYAMDAISPDGRWLYLLRYPSANDPFRYQVLAFDVDRGRVVGKPIVDPREPDEKMAGVPITRAVGPGGRWVYTLYQKQDGEAFIHALDTERRTAACIELDSLGTDFSSVRLAPSPAGGSLVVRGPAGPLAVVDTETFEVRPPAPSAPARPAAAPSEAGADRDSLWVLALIPLAALAAVPALRRRRRRLGS